MIRLFTAPHKTALAPQDDCTGSWVVCSPKTVGDFTAAGYYFGRELWQAVQTMMLPSA